MKLIMSLQYSIDIHTYLNTVSTLDHRTIPLSAHHCGYYHHALPVTALSRSPSIPLGHLTRFAPLPRYPHRPSSLLSIPLIPTHTDQEGRPTSRMHSLQGQAPAYPKANQALRARWRQEAGKSIFLRF
jgi:hypothetical protein